MFSKFSIEGTATVGPCCLISALGPLENHSLFSKKLYAKFPSICFLEHSPVSYKVVLPEKCTRGKCNEIIHPWHSRIKDIMLQSWTKSVKNFAPFLPTECISHRFGTAMAHLIPSPHPSQSCLVHVRNNPPRLQHCFLGGRGSICNCQCFHKLYLETRHGNLHFS